MKMNISFKIYIKEKDKLLKDNYFNDLSKKENELINIRSIDYINNKFYIFVDVIHPIKYMDSNMIEKLLEIYKEEIEIDEYTWSEIGGFDSRSETHYYYDNGVAIQNIIQERLKKYNKEELIEIVKEDNKNYEYIPEKYKYDIDFNLKVINSFDVIDYLPDEMKLNKEVLYKCFTNKGCLYKCENKHIYDNCDVKEIFIKANRINDLDYIYALIPKVLYNDKEFVMRLLLDKKSIISKIYLLLSDDLRIDKEIIDIYVNDKNCNIKDIDKRVKKTDELIKQMISSNISNLRYTKYKNNIDYIKELLIENPYSLEYCSKEIKNNSEIVTYALEKSNYNCKLLKYIGNELKLNKDFMRDCFKKSNHSQIKVFEECDKNKYKKYSNLIELNNSILVIEKKMDLIYKRNVIIIDEFFTYVHDSLLNDLEFIQSLIDTYYMDKIPF